MPYNQLSISDAKYLFRIMISPNLHHLEIFYTVARLGSFSKASEELHRSQPSVLLQVRDLERYYGAPLFHRLGRRIKLTDVGEVVFHYAQQLFHTIEEMKRSVDNLNELVTGRLVLGASSTPGEYLLPRLLGMFNQRHPGVEVDLRISNTATVTRQIISHEIDMGLVGDKVDDRAIICTEFYSDELIVFVSPDHPLAARAKVPVEMLANQPFVMREPGSATRHTAEKRLAELAVPIRIVMQLGSNEAVKRAVAAGLGLGILSKLALEVESAAGYLSPIEVEGLNCKRNFYVLRHRNKYISRSQRVFLDLIQNLD